eukprot:gene9519-4415_t
MFCAMSGSAPEKPVVSQKSGHLFERSLIEKYIENTGKCPVTGEPLEASDLLPLKVSTIVKPRPIAATSIPGMLTLMQNEWDSLMLETYTLKQQLDTMRQELGHAMYQHDAACRVIARLIEERDDARAALTELRPVAGGAAPAADAPAAKRPREEAAAAPAAAEGAGLPAETIKALDATNKALSKGRKKRPAPEGQADAAAIAGYGELASSKAHPAGAVCVDVHATSRRVASGGADGTVCVSDAAGAKLNAVGKLKGKSKVNGVRLHPTKELVVSAHDDNAARVWSCTGGKELHVLAGHEAAVTGLTLHSTGDYCVTTSADR